MIRVCLGKIFPQKGKSFLKKDNKKRKERHGGTYPSTAKDRKITPEMGYFTYWF